MAKRKLISPFPIGPGASMGMELRDYFAAKAMQAMLTGPTSYTFIHHESLEQIPKFAYRIADKMVEESLLDVDLEARS